MKKLIKFIFRLMVKTLIVLILINVLFFSMKGIRIRNLYQLVGLSNIQDKIENLYYLCNKFENGISESLSEKVKDFRNEKT